MRTDTPAPEIPAAPLEWTGSDGTPGAAQLYVPAAGEEAARATVLCLPAMGTPARVYDGLARSLAARGLAVATADLRGMGASPVRPQPGVDFGYGRHVDDLAALAQLLRARLPGRAQLLLGHSLGGHIAVLLAGLVPEAADGLVLVAGGTPYYKNWDLPRKARILVMAQVASAVASALGYFPGKRFGFGGRQPRRLINEWARLSLRGRFVLGADELAPALRDRVARGVTGRRFDVEAALSFGPLPVTSITLEGDWMATRRGGDHLASKVPGTRLTRLHLGPADTDPRGLHHMRWLRHPGAILDHIEATATAARSG